VTINPLVAAGLEGPKDVWAGVWIAEDIQLIHQGVTNGNWIDTSLGAIGAGLDALAFVSDPIASLLQYGIAWIIEHVKPLSEALDWLAGDPAQIAAHAQTWRNAARNDVTDWTGSAAHAGHSSPACADSCPSSATSANSSRSSRESSAGSAATVGYRFFVKVTALSVTARRSS
jgi:hypothetical protein